MMFCRMHGGEGGAMGINDKFAGRGVVEQLELRHQSGHETKKGVSL
jgi:hypothetical protein